VLNVFNNREIFLGTLTIPCLLLASSILTIDAEGNLKDADDIQFYHSEGDDVSISSTKGKAKAG
jgi:hypothetical protein